MSPGSLFHWLAEHGKKLYAYWLQFESIEDYCVYMINKIIHGCLWIWNFSSRVQLDISLVRCPHSCAIGLNTKKNSIFTHAHVLFSIYACGRAHCNNNAICQSDFTNKGYRCLCSVGFTGAHCEQGETVISVFYL